jgi:hypothetical protein
MKAFQSVSSVMMPHPGAALKMSPISDTGARHAVTARRRRPSGALDANGPLLVNHCTHQARSSV